MRYKKAIILAAGKGTRLSPATKITAKPLLPVFDKPMIYYALSTLIAAGVREVLFISRSEDQKYFKNMFGNGKKLGMKFIFAIQKKPIGIPDAMIVGKKFIGQDPFILALADNLFIGKGLKQTLALIQKLNSGAALISVKAKNPSKSAVIEYNIKGEIKSLVEKPKNPKTNKIVTGLYFFDSESVKFTRKLKPSKRGELEIVDIHLKYLKNKQLKVFPLSKDVKWFDTGDAKEMLVASNYIAKFQSQNRSLVGSIELEALKNKFISKKQFSNLINEIPNSTYKDSLKKYLK
tara:strand:+ start:197 stop:1069 length:873 start_codon:yes stop_codon:yes gene_type:complete